jgi:hypothetical protein
MKYQNYKYQNFILDNKNFLKIKFLELDIFKVNKNINLICI